MVVIGVMPNLIKNEIVVIGEKGGLVPLVTMVLIRLKTVVDVVIEIHDQPLVLLIDGVRLILRKRTTVILVSDVQVVLFVERVRLLVEED